MEIYVAGDSFVPLAYGIEDCRGCGDACYGIAVDMVAHYIVLGSFN